MQDDARTFRSGSILGNNSSGKMGAAIAAAARDLGANVHLVLGPTQTALDLKG